MLLFFVLRPFLEGYVGVGLLIDLSFLFILFSGIYAVSGKKVHFVITLSIAVPELAIAWSKGLADIPFLLVVRDGLLIVFFAYIIVITLGYLFRQNEVTTDLIMGAVCVYFFLGFMWAFVFFSFGKHTAGIVLDWTNGSGQCLPIHIF